MAVLTKRREKGGGAHLLRRISGGTVAAGTCFALEQEQLQDMKAGHRKKR